jgi:hypothetical protein
MKIRLGCNHDKETQLMKSYFSRNCGRTVVSESEM